MSTSIQPLSSIGPADPEKAREEELKKILPSATTWKVVSSSKKATITWLPCPFIMP